LQFSTTGDVLEKWVFSVSEHEFIYVSVEYKDKEDD